MDEAKNPSVMSTTRRFFKEYVLGHELPAARTVGAQGAERAAREPAGGPAGVGGRGPGRDAAAVTCNVRPRR